MIGSSENGILLRFLVVRVLVAETAVLLEFKSVRIILLVLIGLVVSLLALFTSQCQLVSCSCLACHVEHLHNRRLGDTGLRIKKDLFGDSKRNSTTDAPACQTKTGVLATLAYDFREKDAFGAPDRNRDTKNDKIERFTCAFGVRRIRLPA